MKASRFSLLLGALAMTGTGATGLASTAADEAFAPTHFKLLEPTSWLIESDRGDPQKAGPCGGTNTDWGTESYVVNEAVGGSMMHIRLQEVVFHPGHYRVALAVNSPTELPPDPRVTTRDAERGPLSVSAEIQDPAQPPVLADGLFAHTARPTGEWEADVQLPNLNCDRCVLQVIQFMAEHANNNPGGYSYHHCAMVHITADPTKPIDTGWPEQRGSDE